MEGNSHTQRVTNFFIETILRPDFGRHERKDREEGLVQRHQTKPSKEPQREREGSRETSAEPGPELRPGDEAEKGPMLWPAWVYCTRYSDRPSAACSLPDGLVGLLGSGGVTHQNQDQNWPRTTQIQKAKAVCGPGRDDKRPRTAFTADQLLRLKAEFQKNRYLTEQRRQSLSQDLGLNESQIKIWFQNKRAKIKKTSGNKNSLAMQLMAQGLYNHSTNQSGDHTGNQTGSARECTDSE